MQFVKPFGLLPDERYCINYIRDCHYYITTLQVIAPGGVKAVTDTYAHMHTHVCTTNISLLCLELKCWEDSLEELALEAGRSSAGWQMPFSLSVLDVSLKVQTLSLGLPCA